MRTAFVLLFALAVGQAPSKLAKRYGLDVNLNQFPQKTPKDSVESIANAIEGNRVDYLLAHLADPEFVDKRVGEYTKALVGSDEAKTSLAFDRLVKETALFYKTDPLLVKELREFARSGEWEGDDQKATAKVKTVPTRRVFLKKIEDRWFLENRQK